MCFCFAFVFSLFFLFFLVLPCSSLFFPVLSCLGKGLCPFWSLLSLSLCCCCCASCVTWLGPWLLFVFLFFGAGCSDWRIFCGHRFLCQVMAKSRGAGGGCKVDFEEATIVTTALIDFQENCRPNVATTPHMIQSETVAVVVGLFLFCFLFCFFLFCFFYSGRQNLLNLYFFHEEKFFVVA